MLWRIQREEEATLLYNEFTDALMKDVFATIEKGDIYLVEMKSRVARKRLLLTGRNDDAQHLDTAVYQAMSFGSVAG
jgi:hypothetical protein